MTEKDDLQKIVHNLASELIEVVNKEHSMLLSEISRMKIIINEASKGLQESFNALSNDNQELVKKIGTILDSNDNPENLNEDSRLSEISKNMNSGIRALQFEDIVQQMLDHARHRIYSIERLFSNLEQKINNFDDDVTDMDNIRKILLECHKEIQNTRKLLDLENPVMLDSLGKNDVTLFD